MKWVDKERLIHSLKTLVACLLGFLLTDILSLSADQWIVITIIVVMCAQLYVGGVMQKAYLRFLGTVLGCLFAMLAIIFFGDNHLAVAGTIGLSAFIFSYLATGQENLSYAGTLGAVTTSIIMLGEQPTIIFAAERFLEISVGILIASMVSQFFLPIHARTHLLASQVSTLKALRAYYESMTHPENPSLSSNSSYQELDEDIVKSLLKQRQLAKESIHEPFAQHFDPKAFIPFLYAERESLRAMNFMQNALIHLQKEESSLIHFNAMHQFHFYILKALDQLIEAVQSQDEVKTPIDLTQWINFKNDIQSHYKMASKDVLFYLNGFLFSADILVHALKTLTTLYHARLNVLLKDRHVA